MNCKLCGREVAPHEAWMRKRPPSSHGGSPRPDPGPYHQDCAEAIDLMQRELARLLRFAGRECSTHVLDELKQEIFDILVAQGTPPAKVEVEVEVDEADPTLIHVRWRPPRYIVMEFDLDVGKVE